MAYRNLISLGLFTLALVLTALVEESASGLRPGAGSIPKKHVVEITAFTFNPENLNVAVGDTVVWINKDVVPHTATASDESWDVDYIEDGKKSTVLIVQNTGNQHYFCRYHPSMKGTLNVRIPKDD